jgi:hypothetical protein
MLANFSMSNNKGAFLLCEHQKLNGRHEKMTRDISGNLVQIKNCTKDSLENLDRSSQMWKVSQYNRLFMN